jgi:hypothetical protein
MGFVFLRRAAEVIFAGGQVACAGHTRLSVRFVLLCGLVVFVLVGVMIVYTEVARLPGRRHVASVRALGGGAADVLGSYAWFLGPVVFNRACVSISR